MDKANLGQDKHYTSPIQPQELTEHSDFKFDCHKGIACFNSCCKNIDILITPYDIIRLKKYLELNSREFVATYTVPFAMDHHEMPGLKLATKPGTNECVFLTSKGCSVYQDRPAACRYYALGNMGMRKKDSADVNEIYFVIKESHCLGHLESKTQTVAEYRRDQGIEKYDAMNKLWRDIILKKRSSGPTIVTPSQRSLQLFDMCSYDLDSFADFIQSEGFRTVFELDHQDVNELIDDQEKLLIFAMRFLKQVLFGEQSIPLRKGARQQRIEQRKETWVQRRRTEQQRWREDQEDQKYSTD